MMRGALLFLTAFLLASTAQAVTFTDLLKEEPKPQEITYKKAGGEEIKLFVFTPAGLKPGDKRPALVWIHGGAWVAGAADVFHAHARYSALRGAVGVSINYRLVKPAGPTLADCFSDCKSAIRYLRAHAAELGIDPEKIVALGDSAGGHLAAALGTVEGFDDPADNLKISAKPNAMVLYNPIVDMTESAWVKFVIGEAALDKKPAPEALVPSPEKLDLAKKLSPLFNVKPGQPPTLLMHGLDDHIVKADQPRAFNEAMKKSGNACQLELLEGARHAFVVPRYTAPESRVMDVVRFTDQWLAGLGFLTGAPTLELSKEPAWPDKSAKPAAKPANAKPDKSGETSQTLKKQGK